MLGKLSIVIPCYNAENTLRQCLDSLKALQPICETEVIIVDDGSTDKTAQIASEYPFRFLRNERNGGASHARNFGVKHSTGDCILFTDSDCVLAPNTLRLVQNALTKTKADCVVGVFSAENPFPDFFSQYKSLYCNFKYRDLVGTSAVNTAMTAIKRSVFEALGGFDETVLVAEDCDLGDRLYAKGFSVYIERELEVLHVKEFNCVSLLKNDFKKALMLSEMFFLRIKNLKLALKAEFTDIPVSLMLNMPLTCASLILVLATVLYPSPELKAVTAGVFLVLLFHNRRFWVFIQRRKGSVFLLKSILFTYLDFIVVSLAIFKGAQVLIKDTGTPFAIKVPFRDWWRFERS